MPIKETNFRFPGMSALYRGKVRDVYRLNDKMIMVATDRISAFDVVLPEAIPHKGQVLNQIAYMFLQATRDIVPNWTISNPDPNVTVGLACEPFEIELVVRGYLAGHAWRTYQSGKRELCGVPLPDGLSENDKLPTPIITPSTKSKEGHDEDISKEEILRRGLATPDDYNKLESYSLTLYNRGTEMAAERGLILVDTKYEFGKYQGEVYLIDEVHTPDSSRYFIKEGYEERQNNKETQKQLSKEFVRQWLISKGFMGRKDDVMPTMDPEWVNTISERYIELYEKITGTSFVPADSQNPINRIENNLKEYFI